MLINLAEAFGDQWLKLCLKLYLSALLSTIYWLNSEALWEQNGC